MRDAASCLVPTPASVREAPGSFRWDRHLRLALDPSSESDRRAAAWFAGCCQERGLRPPDVVTGAAGAPAAPQIVAGQRFRLPAGDAWQPSAEPLGPEGYRLVVGPERITVEADTPAGVFYGLTTLGALLPEPGQEPATRAVEVVDRPEVAFRGYMQDVGRGQVPTLTTLRRNVDRLAALKYNAYLLYLEDGFHYRSRPEIGAQRDRLAPGEVRELVAYARHRHMRVIPIVATLSHMENILRLRQYRELREHQAGTWPGLANPLHPGTWALVEDLLTDVCAAFDDPVVGIGMDETFGLGLPGGASSDMAGPYGGAAGLFTGHVRRAREVLEGLGRRAAIWTDEYEPDFARNYEKMGVLSVGEEHLGEIPRDVLLSSWHYGPEKSLEFGERAVGLGFDLVLQGAADHHGRGYPGLVQTGANAETFLRLAKGVGALGGVESLWEMGPGENQIADVVWPSLAIAAENLWSPRPRPWRDVVGAYLGGAVGAGGEALAEAALVIGDIDSHMPDVDSGWLPGEHSLFQPGGGPHGLSADEVARVHRLLAELDGARAGIERASATATRGAETVAAHALAERQRALLCRLVLARHEAAAGNAAAGPLLAADLEAHADAFGEQWEKVNKPLAMEPNLDRLRAIAASVRALG